MNVWEIYKLSRNGQYKHIDTVFYMDNSNAQSVWNDLVNHDGYDPEIYVVNRKTGNRYPIEGKR